MVVAVVEVEVATVAAWVNSAVVLAVAVAMVVVVVAAWGKAGKRLWRGLRKRSR